MRFQNIVLAVFSFVSSQAATRDEHGGDPYDEYASKNYEMEDIEKKIFNLQSSLGDMEQKITNVRANALSPNEHFDYSSLKEKGSGYEDSSSKYLRGAHTILDEGNTEFDSDRGIVDDDKSRVNVENSSALTDHLKGMTTIFGKGYAVPEKYGGRGFLPLLEHGAAARLFDVNIPDSSIHDVGDAQSTTYERTSTDVEELISTYGSYTSFGGDLFNLFQLSLEFDFNVQELEYASNIFYMREMTVILAYINLDLQTARKCLTTTAKEEMEAIRTDLQAKNFIERYGIAYISQVAVGGRYNMRAQETYKNYFSETDFTRSMSSAFAGLPLHAGGNINVNIENSKSETSVTARYTMRGGDVLADSFEEWKDTVESRPAVVSYDLEPIYELAEDNTKVDSPKMLLRAACEEILDKITPIELPVKQVLFVTITYIDVVNVHDGDHAWWNRRDEIVLHVDGKQKWPREHHKEMHHNSKVVIPEFDQIYLRRAVDDEPEFCLYDLGGSAKDVFNLIECHKFTTHDIPADISVTKRIKFARAGQSGDYDIDFKFYHI